jgi:hypothetical protein
MYKGAIISMLVDSIVDVYITMSIGKKYGIH